MNTIDKDLIAKIAAGAVALFIAGFSYFVVFVWSGNIN